jgi:hypothetical protein
MLPEHFRPVISARSDVIRRWSVTVWQAKRLQQELSDIKWQEAHEAENRHNFEGMEK